MIDDPHDLVSFAIAVDRWLLTRADDSTSAERATLDAQAEQILRRDDVRALLKTVLRGAFSDVFAVASRMILVLVPRAVAGTLPLSLEPPLIAAMALRLANGDSPINHPQASMYRSRILPSSRRRSRRCWSSSVSCEQPGLLRRNHRGGEVALPNLCADSLVDVAHRPKPGTVSPVGGAATNITTIIFAGSAAPSARFWVAPRR